MAFEHGDKITADALNQVNSDDIYINFNHTNSWSGDTYDQKWYSHREAGAPLVRDMVVQCGAFGGVALRLARVDASNNVITWLINENIHGNLTGAKRTYTFDSLGPGWYRLWFDEPANPLHTNAFKWKLYSSQTNCTKGKPLTLYDNPASSGNRLTGTYFTVDNLNSGRAGTINS